MIFFLYFIFYSGSPKEIEESKDANELADTLEADAKAAMDRNDTKGAWLLTSQSLTSKLNAAHLILAGEDETRNGTMQSADDTIATMTLLAAEATRGNRPELSKLIMQKITAMNSTIHGAKVSQNSKHMIIS